MQRRIKFRWIEGEFAVCRMAAGAAVPDWADAGWFTSISRTADELSIVCPRENVPAGVTAESGWSCLKLEGPFPFGEVGILVSVLEPLAAEGIPIFAVSTFDTDYILVKEEFRSRANDVLVAAGHERMD